MYELVVKVTAESNAPPDFILYAIVTHTEVPLEIMGKKFSYEKQEYTHILKRFGLTSEIKIMETNRINQNHYLLRLYIKAKLPFIYESGIGTYHFINDNGNTLCYGGGREIYKGLSGIIVKLSRNQIEKHFRKLWDEYISGATLLWNNNEMAVKYLPKNVVGIIHDKGTFDNLLEFENAHNLNNSDILEFIKKNDGSIKAGDFAIFLGIDLRQAKEKLQSFIENGDCHFGETDNVYIFPDFHIKDIPLKPIDRIEKRLDCLEDWIKIKLVASHQIMDTDPEMAVVRAGKTAESIVKDIYRKHHDGGESNVSTMIKKLSTDGIIPEHITIWMNTIRKLRNEAVHGDGIDKTQALDALNAALNVAEWHMNQLKKLDD